MKLKMKRLLSILLSLTLVIGLMPGMNLTVYAAAPERNYYPINHPNPLNYVADTGNISGQLVGWVYIENDGKEKGPQQTAVTFGAANGHRNNVGLTNIYIHINYAGEQVTQSEPTALHVFAENEGTADITLGGMAIAETAGSNVPGDPTAIKAESSSGGQTTVTAEGQVIAGEDTEGLYLDHTLVNASSTGEGSSTAVTLLSTANGDVKISAADGGTSVINIDNEGQGLGRRATLSSNDDGSLAQLNLKEGNVSEIRFRGEDGTREANINGDVKIQVESYFAGGEANANITGNVGDPNASQGGINAIVKDGGTANYDVDGTIYGHVYLNENRNEDHLDGANINVQAANVEGEVSIGSQHDGKYNVKIEEDITAKEDALKIRNNNSEVNVDVQGSITSNGGTGIAVNNVGDLEWVEAGTFDNVDDLPAGRNEYKSILNPTTTGDEVKFTLDHKSTLNENTEQYNDDILYEYTTDVYTDTPIPLHKDNDPDNPTISRWGINDGNTLTVVYPGNTYKKYEITGEEYNPETQITYARERIDYENTDVTNVNVGEDLIVKGESKELTGISVRSDNKFNETNINIGDNVKVTSLDTNEEGDHTATGIRVDTLEGDININVASDLLVEGGVNDTGIVLNRHAHEEFAASDAEKVNPEELNGFSLGDQIIDGKVVQVYKAEQEDGTALYYDEEGNVYDCVTVANEGTTQIVIGRDVISDGNGVELSAAGEEKTDLIIDGSLFATGGTSVVIKNDDMVLGDNLTLTTWEMTADQDGDYVKREKYDKILNNKIFVADHEAEKAIQYIIRVDERQKSIIHIDGTTRYKDRDVAKEGDKIVVKVDVPEGSAIDEIYCDNNKTKLSQDNNGEYFMIVPRGGGVLLSANFRESKEATVKEEPKPISVTYNGSAQELVTAGTAEGGTIQYALGTDATTAPTTGFTTSIPTGTNADNYFVWFKAVADNKYDTDGETLCLPVSISKASVTVTADDKTKSYGAVDEALTATVSGIKGTDTVDMIAYNLSRAEGENAGTYVITPTGEAEQGNYIVTYENGTFTIIKQLAGITKNPDAVTGLVYDSNNQELVTSGTPEDGITIYYALGDDNINAPAPDDDDATEKTWNTAIPSAKDAGTYYVWFKAVADDNHSTNDDAACIPVSISKANVNVTADDKTKSYDTADAELTAIVSGLKGTDTVDMIAYTLSRAEGENAGTYAITPEGDAEQGNYKVTYVNGTYTIEKANPTYIVPTGLTALTGKTLSDVSLPNGWTWMDKDASVGAAGENTFKAVYTPDDTVNYNTVEDIDVVVTVSEPAPDPTPVIPEPIKPQPTPEPEVKEPELPYTTNETVTNKDGSITKIETTYNKDGSKTEKSVREYLNGNKTTKLTLTNDKGVNLIKASEAIKTDKKGTKTVSTNIQAVNGYNYHSEVKTTKSGKEVSEVKITNADKSSSYEKTVTYPDGNITKNSVKTKADGTADITFGKYSADGLDKSASEAFASDILAGMTPSSGVTGSAVFGVFGSKVDDTTISDMVAKVSGVITAPANTLPADAEIVEELAYTVTSDKKAKLIKCITASEKVTIPSRITINGTSYIVTTIGKNAFKKASSVNCLVLGKTITKFGNKAFNGISKDAVFVMKVKSDTRKNIAKLIKKSGYKNTIQVLYSANK